MSRLLGIHPRWGPHWIDEPTNVDEGTYEIEGMLGDVFRLSTAEQGELYITIAENSTLKEVNRIVFEDFTYSVTRRWYNILQNTGAFRGQIDEGD